MSPETIAFIGGGHMGRALIGGLIRRGRSPQSIRVGEPSEAARLALERDFGCAASQDNAAAVAGAAAVVIAVKPQEAARVVTDLAHRLRSERPLVISVAAGIEIRSLESWCAAGASAASAASAANAADAADGTPVPIVRAMPNRPALVGAGVTALHASERVSAAGRALAESILGSVGQVVWVPAERDLDVVTALSGSGPAYCFLLAELMMQAAVDLGLEPQAARVLAVETLHGAGALAHASSGDLARLRAEVTSKGGTTEAALEVLAGERGMGALVERAMNAAARRSRELARRFGAGE